MIVPKLSIVIACETTLPRSDAAPAWLTAARGAQTFADATWGAGSTELIVVGAIAAGTVATKNALTDNTATNNTTTQNTATVHIAPRNERFIEIGVGALTPERWARGMQAARGRALGLSIDRCELPTGWAVLALASLDDGSAGVGGGFCLAEGCSGLDRAIYHLRYGAFPPGRRKSVEVAGDIAGDNAVYCAESLRALGDEWAAGFWEVVIHRQLRAHGEKLTLAAGMDVAFGGTVGVLSFLRQRFNHGVHFGAWRVREAGVSRGRLLVAAPLVPFLLLLRAWQRAPAMDGGRWGLFTVAPLFLLLTTAWAAGEACGALHPNSSVPCES